ncbi:MAG: glycosyltransferase family 4 protein [Euryarchaeota archaeon]|nr:glycosyltransferase family 4 protein [Euryarchaeota archaeon]
MKIALVHPALMDYRLELFEELTKRHDITFIFTSQGMGQEGAKETHLKIPSEWDCRIVGNDRSAIIGRSMVTYLKLMVELLRSDHDVIITSTKWYICFPIAKITGKKFVLWTESWCWTSNNLTRRLLDLFTIFIAKHADAVIATGTQAYNSHLNIGVGKEKMFTHPQCAIDYSEAPIKDIRKELGLEGKKIILYVGRLVQLKGVDYLIKSFSLIEKKISNAFLVIVGDGPFREECESLADELGIKNIVFAGYMDADKSLYYNACDVFVLPTIFLSGECDCWGLVINEAMAFSKPIVTTDAVGAVEDMVKDGCNGYVVKSRDVQELCRSICKILSNPELAEAMGGNSRKIFEEKNVCRKMADTFVTSIEYVKK